MTRIAEDENRAEPDIRKEYFRPVRHEDLRRKTVTGAAVTITAQFMAEVTQFVGSVVLARILSPDDFGLVLMVAAFSVLLMNFGVNGFTEAIIQQQDLQHRHVNALFWINLGCTAALMLALMAIGPLIARFYGEPRLVRITIAMSLSILFRGLSTQHIALLKRNMQFRLAAGNELICWVITYVLAVILALAGLGYWSIVARQVGFTLALTIGAWFLCSWRPGLPSVSGVREMVKFAMSTYGTFVMGYFQKNLDRILIGRFQGSEPLGSYDRANSLFTLPASQLTAPLTSVSLAALSRLRGDPPHYRQAFIKVISLIAFMGMPLSALMTVVGYDLILLLLGPKWGQAAVLFTLFAPATGISMVYSTHGWLHLSLGKADRWFRWSVIAFAFTGLLFIAGLSHGASGVALGYVIAMHVLAVPGIWYAGRPIDLKVQSLIGAIWKYYASAALAGLATWSLLQNWGVADRGWESHLLRVCMGSSACLSLYLVFTVALHHGVKPIMDFIAIVRESVSGMRVGSRA